MLFLSRHQEHRRQKERIQNHKKMSDNSLVSNQSIFCLSGVSSSSFQEPRTYKISKERLEKISSIMRGQKGDRSGQVGAELESAQLMAIIGGIDHKFSARFDDKTDTLRVDIRHPRKDGSTSAPVIGTAFLHLPSTIQGKK
jgi:hypothetical protein